LSLPFINNALGAAGQPQPFEIIRRPPPGELASSALGASRLYNEAEIRVLLADTPNDLPCGDPSVAAPCGGAGDANNIRLANFNDAANGVNYQFGVPATPVAGLPALAGGATYNTYFATGSTGVPNPTTWAGNVANLPADWLFGPVTPPAGAVTLFDALAPVVTSKNDGFLNPPPAIALSTCNAVTGSCAAAAPYPYYTPLSYPGPTAQMSTWNLIDGYLRVEYRDANGNYHPITGEWLKLGFARGTTPPIAPGANPVNPNAILILQEPADRNANGVIDATGAAPFCVKVGAVYNCTAGKPPDVTKDPATPGDLFGRYGSSTAPGGASPTQYNWYPINFYDAREGEVRDVKDPNPNSCTPAGVMNAVEIDVGNLAKWFNGTIPGSGTLVDPVFQNGYVLYFSDRRGMLPNPNGTQVGAPGTKTGDSGLEDSINTGSVIGTPNGALEPLPVPPPGAPPRQSPEDLNNNGILDNWGAANLGLGLGYVGAPYAGATSVNSQIRTAPGAPDPYLTAGRIASCSIGQRGWVSGARHVVKLVDGSLGYVPVRSDNGQGGFTVASENPVYVLGNYNSNCTAAGGPGCTPGNPNYDVTWNPPPQVEPVHAAAGVLADAVTMLSNNWSDLASLGSPSNDAGRVAATTYYRAAVSGGKNISFLVNVCCAGWAVGDWGTDGGLHNFLRQLEAWGGQTLNYKGSMASLYYSTYSTGTDKNGGGTVYDPPARNYIFDPLFTQPQNLPPGTPLFRDIDNLSYRQSFTPRLTSAY
jgi:hypothetical protein